MFVEVLEQFGFLGWAAVVEYVKKQTKQHREDECNAEQKTNNYSFYSHFLKRRILTTGTSICGRHPNPNLTIKVEIYTRVNLDLRPQILNLGHE